MTKKYNILKIVFLILSIYCISFPLVFYGIQAFIYGSKVEKFTLGSFCVVAALMVAINYIMKLKLKSMIWLILLGIYICLGNIQTLLIMMAVCTVLEEVCFWPLYKYYKAKHLTSKEIDKRIE